MLDINAAINDAIAKAVESHIGAIHAQYSSTLGRLQERLDLFEDKVYGRLSDIESRALNSIDVLAERVKDNHRVTEGSLRDLSLSLGRTENEVKIRDNQTSCIEDDLRRLSQQVYEAHQAIGPVQMSDGSLTEQVRELEKKVHTTSKHVESDTFNRDVRDVLETMSSDGALWDLIDESVRDEIDDYLDSSKGEMRINDAVSEALGDEYLKKCDFSDQLQECLDHEITLKVTVE
jgi:hypothetical protein